MILPLLSGGRLQGVIVLTWAEVYELTATEQFLLRRLVRPTAALLSRRRAYLAEEAARTENEQRAAQFQTAVEIAHAASSIIDLDELLPRAVQLVWERFDLSYVGVFLVDESGRHTELRAGTGEPEREMLKSRYGFAVDISSMIGRCVLEGEPQVPEDGETDVGRKNRLASNTMAEMALPLINRNQVIGAMSVQSRKVSQFLERDIVILQTVTDQLATAIENARLFDQLNASLTESEMQTEVSLAVNEAQSVEELLQAVIYIGEFFGMQGVSLRLFTRWDQHNQPLTQDVHGMVRGR